MIQYFGLLALFFTLTVGELGSKTNRPGVCPQLIDILPGLQCKNPCTSDDDCNDDNLKCCLSDCGGHECIELMPATQYTACKIACTKELRPVCGSDGVTYPNPCMLNYITCSSNQRWITMVTEGPCQKSKKTQANDNQRESCASALEEYLAQALIGSKRPQCDEEGYYLPKQCHPSTGYCWCSDRSGKELSEPSRFGVTSLECARMRDAN